MTDFLVNPSALKGILKVPTSKSQSLRAILFGAMGWGKSCIYNYLNSPDIVAMVEAFRLLGATINITSEKIEIVGIGGKVHYAEDVINAGNSGLILRFFTAIAALGSLPVVITGDYSIRHRRPMLPLIKGLEQLGVSVKTMKDDGFAPVIVQGPIQSNKVTISGEDSQPISSLLIMGAFSQKSLEIEVLNPGEKPWVALTLNWFQRLEIPYENHHYEHYQVKGNCRYEGFDYSVPGDFSTAAFLIAAALITESDLTLENINMEDPQGDKKLIEIFIQMGANIEIDEKKERIYIKKGEKLKNIIVDINDFIDSITILAVVACFAEGEMTIFNAEVAKHKECNRIQCITTELRKMGASIVDFHDGLKIQKSSLHGAKVKSYSDHRMAMSLTVAALGAKGSTLIEDVDCVSKTYASFFEDFSKLGAFIQVIE